MDVSPVDRFVSSFTSLCDRAIPPYLAIIKEHQASLKRLESWVQPVIDRFQDYERLLESSKRWAEALAIVQTELPKRGWYLSGKEPARLTQQLARSIAAEDWEAVDAVLIEQSSGLQLDDDKFCGWLRHNSVKECCVNRMRIFLKARQDENHEVATLVGVPLIDELSRCLYGGRDFTTKRSNKQPKPQMGCVTGSDSGGLTDYCKGFVEAFGLIHEDVDTNRLEDEDYFNRSAIIHGLMRRSYGQKDSAKCFMVLMFLVCAVADGIDEADGQQ